MNRTTNLNEAYTHYLKSYDILSDIHEKRLVDAKEFAIMKARSCLNCAFVLDEKRDLIICNEYLKTAIEICEKHTFYEDLIRCFYIKCDQAKRKNKTDPLGEGMELYQSRDGKLGLKDNAGKFVVAPKWDHIAWIGPRVAAAWNGSEGGIFDPSGTALFRDDAKRRWAEWWATRTTAADPRRRSTRALLLWRRSRRHRASEA